jgi:hypothetical protein
MFNVNRNTTVHYEGRIRIVHDDLPQAAPAVVLSIMQGGTTTTITGATKMAYTLPADKRVKLGISYLDAKGNPASIDGEVSWTSSDTTIANVDVADDSPPDHSVVWVTPATAIGSCQISANADADLGEGVRDLVTLMDLTVVGGEAVAGTIQPVGAPEPIPARRTGPGPGR